MCIRDSTGEQDDDDDDSYSGRTSQSTVPDSLYVIDMSQVKDTDEAFTAMLAEVTSAFNISVNLIKEMQSKNKQLVISRKDIELIIQPGSISEEEQLKVTIESKPAIAGLTHDRDRALSSIYTVDMQSDAEGNALNGKFNVRVPIDMTQVNNPEKCAVFIQDEKGDWQPAGGVIDVASGTMQASIPNGRPFAVLERDIAFEDVEGRWSQDAVEVLAAKGIITGKPGSQFGPSDLITRAEFTAMIVRSLFEGRGNLTSELGNDFSDVKADAWYAGDIVKAAELNLMNGIGNGRYAPDERITREQMIVILNRLYELKGAGAAVEGTPQSSFDDMDEASGFAKEAIANMAGLGVINGSNGQIMPKDDTSREEAAMMIYRLLKKIRRI
jgi:hypothetical protein